MVRLDDEPDDVDKTLSLALLESKGSSNSSSNSLALSDPLAASSWAKVALSSISLFFCLENLSSSYLGIFWFINGNQVWVWMIHRCCGDEI